MSNQVSVPTERFTSRFAAILTLIGVAVGLGNVWRFPYMMGSYGGSAFLAVYLLFTLLFAIPALMAEIALGKAGGGGVIAAFTNVYGRKAGKVIGYALLVTVTIAGSYYSVVLGNVFFTALFSIFRGFDPKEPELFGSMLGNPAVQYPVNLLVIALALAVIALGVRAGIERASKITVPFFLVAIVYLIFYSLAFPGAFGKLAGFLRPDLSLISPAVLFAALGQAFFSVGLGGTFMVVYGSYLRENASIPKIALSTALGNACASILASLFLVPAILVFGLSLSSGPGLIFKTLPRLFSSVPYGRFAGSLFLVALSLVAFLSLVAAYQVVLRSLAGEIFSRKHRTRLIVLFGAVQALLALPSGLYPPLIGGLDLIFGSGMQVFGSILAVTGITWGLGRIDTIRRIFGTDAPGFFGGIVYYWLRYAVPVVLFAVLAVYISSLLG